MCHIKGWATAYSFSAFKRLSYLRKDLLDEEESWQASSDSEKISLASSLVGFGGGEWWQRSTSLAFQINHDCRRRFVK